MLEFFLLCFFFLLQLVSTSAEPLQLQDLFGDIEIFSTSGVSVKVSSLWTDRRVVVAWARHFG